MSHPSFARVRRFGRRTVGSTVAVTIFGLAATACLTALLLLLPLLTELLSAAGALTVSSDDSAAVNKLGVKPAATEGQLTRYENCGLLPTVWRLRESILGPTLARAYTSWDALRENRSCLTAVIVAVWCLSVLSTVMLYWLKRSVEKTAVNVTSALRKQIYDQAHHLGAGDLFIGQRWTSAELFTTKTEAVHRALVAWWWLVPHITSFALLTLCLALAVDFWLSLSAMLLVALSWRLFAALRRHARQQTQLMSDRAEQISALLLDQLSQNRALGNLNNENGADSAAFEDQLRHYDAALLSRKSAASLVGPLVTLFVLFGASLVLCIAAVNVLHNPPRLSLPGVVLLCASLSALVYPLICVERLLHLLPADEQAADEIFVYLDRQPRVGQLLGAAPLGKLRRQIDLDHVTLADMTGRLLLDDVSCSLPIGRPAVVFSTDDATGVALAGLLPRFCDPAAGQVLFDGRDARLTTIDSVRRQVAIVLPDHLLVSGTLAENVGGDNGEFTSDQIMAAMKRVHAEEFVHSLPDGLASVIGPQTLSVGQAIHVGLARVMLAKPSVLVIQEPLEDLDQTTAERIADALEQISRECTVVILARRLATLRAAPRILLFHEGRLLADGTHQELLQRNDLYRHLNYVRFNEFRDKVR